MAVCTNRRPRSGIKTKGLNVIQSTYYGRSSDRSQCSTNSGSCEGFSESISVHGKASPRLPLQTSNNSAEIFLPEGKSFCRVRLERIRVLFIHPVMVR